MKALGWWWPKPEHLNEILLIDAVAHSPAVILAVHRRMQLLKRHHSQPIGAHEAVVDEQHLLERLTTPATAEGIQLTLIEGRSGTGKSHVVHWLKIQLERRSDRDTRVVLAVAKGSRLRDIVHNLCRLPELQSTKHASLRERLTAAQNPVDPEDAAHRLCNQLAFVCSKRHEEAKARTQAGIVLSPLESLYRKWGGPKALPHILVYSTLRPAFVDSKRPMRRLVDNLHAKATILRVREKQEFVAEDFIIEDIPDGIDTDAQRCLRHLETSANREEVVLILNDALDEAKRILLGLDPGVVAEVFKSIRRVLNAQGKELILLVEDFADLSGLRREVLQAAIQTRREAGNDAQYCTLRTVVAFTDNLIQETTVLTRAQHIYYVPNGFDEASAIDRSVGLIAAYLQAARIGKDALERAYGLSSGENWMPEVPDTGDEAAAILKGFGTEGDVSLFPFNHRAIRQLLQDQYRMERDAGRDDFPFVPRDIVTTVMNRVLAHRDAFLRGEFPSEAFVRDRGANIDGDDTRWLNQVGVGDSGLRSRLLRFLPYWGRDRMATRAFGLPEPDVGDTSTVPPTSTRPSPQTPLSTSPPQSKTEPATSSFGSDVRSLFEQWRQGTQIVRERNDIRKSISKALEEAFAWQWEPRAAKANDFNTRWKQWHEGVQIAGMRSADDIPLTFELVTDRERDEIACNDFTVTELTSMFAASKVSTWDIDGVESYLAAYSSFVERHRERVQKRLLSHWYMRDWNALPWIVTAIRHTGAVLGVPKGRANRIDDLVESLFASAAETSVEESTWRKETLAKVRQSRISLQEILKREIGAFQGTGDTLHALDVSRLAALLDTDFSDLSIPAFPHGARGDAWTAFVSAKKVLDDLQKSSRDEIVARQKRAETIASLLGSDPDIGEALAAVLAFRVASVEAGVITADQAGKLEKAASALQELPIIRALRSAAKLRPIDELSFLEQLEALGTSEADTPALVKAEAHLTTIRTILDDAATLLAGGAQHDPLDDARAAHQNELAEIRGVLVVLQERDVG